MSILLDLHMANPSSRVGCRHTRGAMSSTGSRVVMMTGARAVTIIVHRSQRRWEKRLDGNRWTVSNSAFWRGSRRSTVRYPDVVVDVARVGSRT